jgi:hypothetical protein
MWGLTNWNGSGRKWLWPNRGGAVRHFYCTLHIHRSRDYRQNSATVTHALRFLSCHYCRHNLIPLLLAYPNSSSEGLRKTTKNVNHDSRCPEPLLPDQHVRDSRRSNDITLVPVAIMSTSLLALREASVTERNARTPYNIS